MDAISFTETIKVIAQITPPKRNEDHIVFGDLPEGALITKKMVRWNPMRMHADFTDTRELLEVITKMTKRIEQANDATTEMMALISARAQSMELSDYIKKISAIAKIDKPSIRGSRVEFYDPFSFNAGRTKTPVVAQSDDADDLLNLIDEVGGRMEQANEAVEEMAEMLLSLMDKERIFFIERDAYSNEMAAWLAHEGQLKAAFDIMRLTSVKWIFIRFDDVADAVHFKLRWL